MHSSIPVRKLAMAAVTAAMYTALGTFGGIFGLTYWPVQCRFAEALTLLPFLFPETAWGLFVGCILTNLLSMYGPVDIVFGSLATLIAALWTARCKNKWSAAVPPVVCNGVIVSAVIAYAEVGVTNAFWSAWAFNALTVAAGEAAACFILGVALVTVLERTGAAGRLRSA